MELFIQVENSNLRVNLRKASELSGLSRDTLWRAIRTGQIPAMLASGRGGRQYRVHLEEVLQWKAKASESFAGASDSSGGKPELSEAPAEVVPSICGGSDAFAGVPHVVHLESLRMLENAHTDLRRLERQSTALGCELQLYRKSLTEAAESLAEKEAFRLQAEKLASQLDKTEERVLELEQQKALVAQQLHEVTERERELQGRWQRVPRWVRRLLGVA